MAAPSTTSRSTPDPDDTAEIASAVDTITDTVVVTQQDVLQTMEAASASLVTGVSLMQREMAEFVSERLRQDMEAQQKFLRCKTLEDMRSVQSMFIKTAMDQYTQEATRLFRLGSEIMSKAQGGHRD